MKRKGLQTRDSRQQNSNDLLLLENIILLSTFTFFQLVGYLNTAVKYYFIVNRVEPWKFHRKDFLLWKQAAGKTMYNGSRREG